MKVLYIGDVMARPGRQTIAALVPEYRKKYKVDVVAVQAENVSHGIGMSLEHYNELKNNGVDFFTGGNHSVERKETLALIADPTEPVNGPANLKQTPHKSYKLLDTPKGQIAFVSLLGATFPKGYPKDVSNPLLKIDEILDELKEHKSVAIIVNFHGDLSSEKRVIGYYLDGKASAVVGDHWHVPSADAMVLPKGTAHITDVGMCGALHSSLGVPLKTIIPRWRDGKKNVNDMDTKPPFQFNAVLIDIDEKTGLARSIERIQKIIDHPL
jgi:2',3'-cyclic-nucleotide 2'-phosphodiesterase